MTKDEFKARAAVSVAAALASTLTINRLSLRMAVIADMAWECAEALAADPRADLMSAGRTVGGSSKYARLATYLSGQSKAGVKRREMTFGDVARILGSTLPPSAYTHHAWWSNHRSHTQARNGWLAAGWGAVPGSVDLDRELVEFRSFA